MSRPFTQYQRELVLAQRARKKHAKYEAKIFAEQTKIREQAKQAQALEQEQKQKEQHGNGIYSSSQTQVKSGRRVGGWVGG